MLRFLVFLALFALVFMGGTSNVRAAEPIKIGVVLDLSGPASGIGAPSRLVVKMILDWTNNESNGVDYRPLELVVGNTEGEPEAALREAKRLVEQEKVVAVIGPARADTVKSVKPYLEAARMPTITIADGASGVSGKKAGLAGWTFTTAQRNSLAVRKVYDYLVSRNKRKIGLLTASDGFGREGAARLKELASEYGMDIVAEEVFDIDDTDVTPQLTSIRNGKPDALVCWTVGPSGARVARNVRALGVAFPLIQSHGQADSRYIGLAGEAAEGTILPSTKLMVAEQIPETDPQKAGIRDFVHLYADIYGFSREYPLNVHSGYAWDAVYLLINSIRQVGTDPEALRNSIEHTRGFVGVSGVYSFSAEDHHGLGTDSLVMVKVEKGKFVLLQ